MSNQTLTVKPAVENGEYRAFVGRILRSYGKRVAVADPVALADLVKVRAELDQVMASAVDGLRTAGYSWTDIARSLGVSRQAAQQRWGK